MGYRRMEVIEEEIVRIEAETHEVLSFFQSLFEEVYKSLQKQKPWRFNSFEIKDGILVIKGIDDDPYDCISQDYTLPLSIANTFDSDLIVEQIMFDLKKEDEEREKEKQEMKEKEAENLAGRKKIFGATS